MNIGPLSSSKSEKSAKERPCLLVILGCQLALAKDLRWPLKGFVVGNKQYHGTAFGEWTGFYDWLRDGEATLLGVRYTPFEYTEFLVEHAKTFPYAKLVAPGQLEIFFSEQRAFEPKLSCDQDFAYDAIFRLNDGEYAIGFGIEALSESNLRSLTKVDVEWVDVRPFE
jgi:hypothetical protein